NHEDKILSTLSRCLVERRLFKVKFQASPFSKEDVESVTKEVCTRLGIPAKEATYFVLTGEATNTTYNSSDERITILFKDGVVRDISALDNALITHNLSG